MALSSDLPFGCSSILGLESRSEGENPRFLALQSALDRLESGSAGSLLESGG
jgi:hypothetical protein